MTKIKEKGLAIDMGKGTAQEAEMLSKLWRQFEPTVLSDNKNQPLHDRVILEPLPVESKSAGGIIIPDTAKEKPQRGKILYVGNGVKDEAMTVKVGDTVLYGKHAGQPINIDDKPCLIMREADILMII